MRVENPKVARSPVVWGMRKAASLVLLSCLVPLLALRSAQALEVKNGGFELPKKAKHGAAILPGGFRVEGKAARLTRFQSAPPNEQAVALRQDVELIYDVVVPKPIAPKKLDPEGWYAVASVDVLGLVGDGKASLKLSARQEGKRSAFASTEVTPDRKASRSGRTIARRAGLQRAWLRIPPERLTPLVGKTLSVALSVAGKGRIAIDNFRLDLFHREPGRVLVGKPALPMVGKSA